MVKLVILCFLKKNLIEYFYKTNMKTLQIYNNKIKALKLDVLDGKHF